MNSKIFNRFNIVFLLGSILLGGLFGYNFPQTALNFNFISQFVLSILIFLSIPLLIIITINGVSQMADHKKSNRSLLKIFIFFAATTLIAVLIALPIGLITNSSLSSNTIDKITISSGLSPETIDAFHNFSAKSIFSFSELTNFQSPTGSGFLLTLILLAIIFGTVIYRVEDKDKIVSSFFKSSANVLNQVILQIIKFLPIGLFFITASLFARNADNAYKIFENLSSFSIGLTIALLIQLLVVYPLAVRFMGHRSPFLFIKNNLASMMTVFATGSKLATAPILYNDLEEKTDIDPRSTQMTIPLGTLFNAAGSAIYLTLGALFIFHLSGIELSILNYITLIVFATILALISTFVPNLSLVTLSLLLTMTYYFGDNPIIGLSLLLAGDWLFNRMAQVVNLIGDASTAAVISESFDFKTARVVRKYSKNEYSNQSQKSTVRQPKERKSKPRKEKPSRQKDRTERKPKRQDKRRSKQEDKQSVSKPVQKEVKKESPKLKEKETIKENISDTNLEMPPVPHHFLEESKKSEDSKAKEPKPAKPAKAEKIEAEIKEKEKAEEKVSLSIKLKSETFERERAKISAQLEAMKKAESKIKIKKTDVKEEKPALGKETKIEKSEETKVIEQKKEEKNVNIDFPEIPEIPPIPEIPKLPDEPENKKEPSKPETPAEIAKEDKTEPDNKLETKKEVETAAENNEKEKPQPEPEPKPKPVPELKAESEPEDSYKNEEIDEQKDPGIPKIDFYAEPKQEIELPDKSENPQNSSPEPSTENDNQDELVYGRTKKSKAVALKDNDSESEESESNETDDISYSKENIKFGRSYKRKK